jgi:hypothetical protein
MKFKIAALITLISFLLNNPSKAQSRLKDTSFFYSILLVEKEILRKDISNAIVSGDMFSKVFIISDKDTIWVAYEYPFLKFDKNDFLKLKRHAIGSNNTYLIIGYKNEKKSFLIKMPFNILFDKYWLMIIHQWQKSNRFNCIVSSYSASLNTSNKQFFEALNIRDSY